MSLFSDVFSLPVHFAFCAVFSYCLHFAKFVCLLKRLQRLKQEQQKSPAGIRQTYDRFGLEKLKENQPNYQRQLLLTVLPPNYLMTCSICTSGQYLQYRAFEMQYTVLYQQVELTVIYREADIIVYAVNSFISWEINTERLRNNPCLLQCKICEFTRRKSGKAV